MWTFAAIFILAFGGCVGNFKEQELVYKFCGDLATITHVTSTHTATDRIWNFECQKVQYQLGPGCSWSKFFAAADKEVHFNCRANHVLTGVLSDFNKESQDREWAFLCCSAENMVTYDCGESSMVNYFKEDFKFSVPGSNYMTGMRSYGADSDKDHRWGFSYCRATVLDSQAINSEILKINNHLTSQLTEGDIATPLTRSAATCTDCKWTKNSGLVQVPYAIQGSFSSTDKDAILSAMTDVQLSTCVRFVPVSGQADYVSIENIDGCWSYVGRTGGAQKLSLGAGCLGASTIQHELIHALGFWHEHTRTDRDLYVNIHWENIQDDQVHNFHMKETNNLNVAYDTLSLMHYGPKDFSKNGENTITIKAESTQSSQGMSEKDILKINKLYDCSDYLHKNGVWDSQLKETMTKQCPSGQAVSGITSSFDESSKDRLWGITCKPFAETKACVWSNVVNGLWEYMDFKCAENEVITGVHSTYNGVLHDRVWKFQCCRKPEFTLTDCKEGPVVNYWGEHFHWKVASNNYLTGVKSSFDGNIMDRRWTFTYCQKK